MFPPDEEGSMKLKVIVHEAEEGGFWGEVPAIPGCASQGDTLDELMANLHEAIEGCMAVDVAEPRDDAKERILEIAV
jgi:predicted RNase H-like HicB family nuclease